MVVRKYKTINQRRLQNVEHEIIELEMKRDAINKRLKTLELNRSLLKIQTDEETMIHSIMDELSDFIDENDF